MAAMVVEYMRGHYEAREIHFGKDYVWCPECVVVECECGERVHFTASEDAFCGCGREHSEVVREEMESRRMRGNGDAPWREELRFGPERSEYRDWVELNELD